MCSQLFYIQFLCGYFLLCNGEWKYKVDTGNDTDNDAIDLIWSSNNDIARTVYEKFDKEEGINMRKTIYKTHKYTNNNYYTFENNNDDNV